MSYDGGPARLTAEAIRRSENPEVAGHANKFSSTRSSALPRGGPVTAGPAGNGNVAGSDPYPDAIQQLSSKLGGLASKADVEDMKAAVIGQTKVLISEAADPLKSDFEDLQASVGKLEQETNEQTYDSSLTRKVEDIDTQLAGMKWTTTGKETATAVVWGLASASSADAAKDWLRVSLKKTNIDGVLDMYAKGINEFNGLLFISFFLPRSARRESRNTTP